MDPDHSRYAAVGSVGDNEAYLALRLQYADSNGVEETLAGAISWQQTKEFLLRAVVTWILVAAVSTALMVVVAAVTFNLAAAGSVGFGGGLAAVAASVATVFLPHRELLGEWQLLLDGKAPAADSAFAAIYGALAKRRLPVRVSTRRIGTAGHPGANNYLIVSSGSATAYIASFGYGTGLYLGWTLWRSRIPLVMMLNLLLGALGGLRPNTVFRGVLESSTLRALREAVHSAAREGVDVAVHGVDVPIVATFGHDIPIETPAGGPSRVPVPVPPPVAQTAFPRQPEPVPPTPPTPPAPPLPPLPPPGGERR